MKIDLKINFTSVLLIFALVALALFFARSCTVSNQKVNSLKEKLKVEKAAIEMMERDYAKTLARRNELITELNGMIDSSMTVIADLETEDKEKEGRLAELEEELTSLPMAEEKVANLTEQVEIWKQRFSLAQKQLIEKNQIIFSLNQKYEIEHELRLQAEDLLKDYREATATQVELIGELQKSLNHRVQFQWMERGVGVLLIGTLAYLALK